MPDPYGLSLLAVGRFLFEDGLGLAHMRYTDDLTYRLIAYMRDQHHIELSTSQAEGFLDALAGVYGWAGGMAARASARAADRPDLIFVPLNNQEKKS